MSAQTWEKKVNSTQATGLTLSGLSLFPKCTIS